MQNYHFTPEGDFLDLISKNYYEFLFMWISWLHNLFYNLTIIYAYNNNFSMKTIKFRKLVTMSKLACESTMEKLTMKATQ